MAATRSIDVRFSRFVCGLLVLLSACGGGSQDSAPAPTPMAANVRPVSITDIEIAQLLYQDNQRTPSGFYKDSTPTFPGYVATAHLKSTDLPGAPSSQQYELCSDDWTVALGWSDQAAAAMSASTLVETNATARYHEFLRVRVSTPQGYLRTRVYRCSYLDRSTADLRAEAGAAGQFNQRPIAPTELQQLIEYLWQFTTYNNFGNAVLKSSGTNNTTGLQHTLIIASFAQVVNGCERVNVFEWTHFVDGQTGILRREVQPLWDFGARRNAGLVELCNPF